MSEKKKKKWIKSATSSAEKESVSNPDTRHKKHVSPSKMMRKMYGSKE